MGQQKSNFIVRGGADFSNINKGLLNTQKKFNTFQSGISKAMKGVGIALSTIAVGKFIKDSTKMAMTVESSMDNINRNMQKSSRTFQIWVNTQSKGLGIARKDAYQYGSTFSNLLGSFLSTSKETAESTQELMKASAIIASKTGRTYDDVANRIRSGMLGSTEAIEDLGVYTNISMIESTNAFKKFANGKSWSQLDFKVQQQIRLAAILEQTYSRYGDTLAETTQTKQARFLASLSNIKLNIGQAFLPIYNVVLPVLTAFANKLEEITSIFSAMSEAFFGKAISIDIGDAETGSDTYTDLGNSIETAGKKAKKAVAPFDELKQVNSNTGSNASSNGSNNKPNNSFTVNATNKNTGFVKSLEKLKEVLTPTTKALGRFGDALKPIGKFVFDNIINFYNYGLKPIGKWVLGNGLPRLLDVGTGLLNSINWSKLTDALKNLYGALSKFVIGVGSGLITFIELMASILKPIIATTADMLAKAINGIAIAIKAIPEDVAIAIGGAIGGIVTAFLGFQLASGVIGIIGNLKDAFKGLLTSISAHPLLWIAGGIAALAGASEALAKAKFDSSQFGQYIKGLNELQEKARGFNKEVDTMLENYDKTKEKVEIEYGAVSILANEYFKLADKTNLTNKEQALLVSYAQELINKIPELSGLIDSQTGAYKGTKDEINSLIQKTKEYYLVQAARENLIEIAKKQYLADKLITEQTQKRNEVEQKLNDKLKEQEEYYKNNTSRTMEKMKADAGYVSRLSSDIFTLTKELGEFDVTIKDTKESQNSLNKEWEYASGFIAKYSSTGEADINKVKAAVESIDLALIKANISTKAKGMISDFNKEFNKDTSSNGAISSWLGKISGAVSKFKLPNIKVGLDVDTSSLNNINARNQIKAAPYATGGFPSTGELFVANENGPEMLGKMGNRNVVANNMQITDGIEQAAYNGFTRALKDSGGLKTNLRLDTNSKGLFKVVQDESIDYFNRTGSPAFG
ncbi:hypothetical protein [Lachnoclostridium sp.]|uniref:hypothetical protein n=1 Tax=Lachnoclostridium sp. TaxID=2028282 RepID=UPI0028990EE5|nr:hypothetical protein [Lachnoclostridium sp.]